MHVNINWAYKIDYYDTDVSHASIYNWEYLQAKEFGYRVGDFKFDALFHSFDDRRLAQICNLCQRIIDNKL